MTNQRKIKRVRCAEMEWLGENEVALEKKYPGKWIAIKEAELVGVGDSVSEARKDAASKGKTDPLFAMLRPREYQGAILIPSFRIAKA